MAETIATTLAMIDNKTMLLPEFQRGYVWNRDQVRGLMRSLYHRYPVGSLLVWQTNAESVAARGTEPSDPGYVNLLLDGQQRVTTLYGIMRGTAPPFFEGHLETLQGLHFHLGQEAFEFYSPAKMRNDLLWVDVTKLMKEGMEELIAKINTDPALSPRLGELVTRMNRLLSIKETEFHIETITGSDKTVDVVVEIFDRVNSGGTKLSKADLALAKLCAEWPDARDRMRAALARWKEAGYNFKLDWLLRSVNAVVNGEAIFTALASVSRDEFEDGLRRTERATDALLNNISARLGLDHDRVLAGRYSFPVMARYLDQNGGRFPSAAERDKLLYWYVQSFIWGRYIGASETILNQDLDGLDTGGIDRVIDLLKQTRGELRVRPEDFAGYSLGARFYPLLYLLTRVHGAKDWWNGAPELSHAMLGRLASLQVHHIFPKARLYENGFERGQVNAIANFCYLTQDTNLWVTDRLPEEYFAEVEAKYPGALASQWVPMDRDLWRIERYEDFLEARRTLLAAAANLALDELLTSTTAVPAVEETSQPQVTSRVEAEPDAVTSEVRELVAWLDDRGYSTPELDVEIVDPETGESLAVAEAVWPSGLQEGIGDPVLLELELTGDSEAKLAALGWRVFGSVDPLREFVEREMRERVGEAAAAS